MFYHNLGHRNHGFEITIDEFMVLTSHFVKNGFNVNVNLNEFNVDDPNSDWGWSLVHNNGDGLYHLCISNEYQNSTAEWICEFFKARNLLCAS